jgi:hypothetical protein
MDQCRRTGDEGLLATGPTTHVADGVRLIGLPYPRQAQGAARKANLCGPCWNHDASRKGMEPVRVLLNVEIDTEKGNELIEAGRMGEVMEGILSKLKPEASYFYPRNGRRAMTLVVESADNASLMSLAEPFWIQLGARVEAVPCTNADELREGLSRL